MNFIHAALEFKQKYSDKKYQHPNLQASKTINSILTDTYNRLHNYDIKERVRFLTQAVINQQRIKLYHTDPLEKKMDKIKSKQTCVQFHVSLHLIPDLSNIINNYMGFQEQLLFIQELKQDIETLPDIEFI